MVTPPHTTRDLRDCCAGWPDGIVRRAVVDAFEEVGPDNSILANFVVNWLIQVDLPEDMDLPLPPDLIDAIWRHLEGSRH